MISSILALILSGREDIIFYSQIFPVQLQLTELSGDCAKLYIVIAQSSA